ncbi:SLC13 family permease [Phycicoccus sp. HDW14]|uniref:SLC13 family permease n=1 Tax=Phycicoccus sp. HDW14 TaxID=2714941 RepID=UPI00197B7BD3|nr:ArsB/NhaD family transporter [Phycicoccus sp. HDW14]
MTSVLAVAVFVGAYVLIATEKLNRTAVALGGAAAMVLIGVVRGEDVFFSEDTGVDWNVIFLLLGMMIIVGILRQTGVFEFVAIWAAQRSRARPFRMMALLIVITAVASALLDNVTTVLLVAPVTLLLCDRLALAPVPFLLAEAMASNIGGTATLIGDPPNIIIASRAGLTFNDFLVHLAPVVVVLLGVFVLLAWLLWGRRLRYDPERAEAVMALTPRETISDPRLLRRMLLILGAVLVGFLTHPLTGLDPSLVALLGAGASVLASRLPSEKFLADVEWETLLFFAGLFVMVGSLVKAGIIGDLAGSLTDAIGENYLAAAQGILVGSAALSGIVDNIPYVATMSPLVHDLVGPGAGLPPGRQSLWWALALGADLGGNATAIGASANVVITGIAKRNDHPISFWTFTRYGLIVTAATIGICVPYVWLRYFVLAG